jgi:outer membrane lipoprotein SlyB
MIEKKAGQTSGVEITVRLDGSNELRAIVQSNDEALRPGERVRLISSDGITRVSR